ncbi:glutamate 5-kinase [Deltaproteobacteria bacterium OttesenSCG-928-K17]|nr:glutamate 5-kinase [Deltaproteobacteria bacterium OttesenSCG-928-K17]
MWGWIGGPENFRGSLMLDSRQSLRKSRRLVFKIGTNILFENEGLSRNRLKVWARQAAELKRQGREVIIVSSGAIGAGFKKLGLNKRPDSIKMKQACAAVGQVYLMAAWEKALNDAGLLTAQILISASDLADRTRFLNAKNTLIALLERGVVPVINENDTVALDELKFGDNDTLAALVAGLVEADFFINLTDIDGLYSADPRKDSAARIISDVEKVSPAILALAGDGGPLGSGGMYTKVRAAKRLSELGIASAVAAGLTRDILLKVIDGEPLGTFFKPQPRKLHGRKNWLAFASRPKGKLVVDPGCVQAISRRGKSLLPGGICGIEGTFAAADPVAVVDESGQALAYGLTNYTSAEVEKIMGRGSRQIVQILGYSHSDEVIHRDNLVLADGLV